MANAVPSDADPARQAGVPSDTDPSQQTGRNDADPSQQTGQNDADGGRRAAEWRVPVWALIPASLAPLLLLVGPIIAGRLQPASFDPVRDSISALAADNAADRSVMTVALAIVGLAHLGTAVALIGAGLVGRILLGVVGVSTALVAVFPLPSEGRTSWTHAMFAVIAFLILAWWPLVLLARRWGPAPLDRPFPARRRTAIIATAVMFALLAWFGLEQLLDGSRLGLSERVAAVAESIWPLVVVSSALVAKRENRAARAPAATNRR